MKTTITTLLLIFIALLSFAQAPVVQWSKVFQTPVIEEGYYINTTCDGGYITASMINERGGDICLRKLDGTGKLLWKKNYGGSLGEFPKFVEQTKDGGYFVMGNSSSSDGDIKHSMLDGNIWAFKVDGKGVLEWEQILGTDPLGYGGKQ